jgi:hypothetical protein
MDHKEMRKSINKGIPRHDTLEILGVTNEWLRELEESTHPKKLLITS